jgi:hypothetical protein
MKSLIITSVTIFLGLNAFAQTDNNLFNKLRKSIDNNAVYYYDKSSPTSTNSKSFFIYLVQPNQGNPYLMVRFQYKGSSPVGVYGYNVNADRRNSFNITPPTGMINKGGGNGVDDFRSQCDLRVENKFLQFLREITKAENPTLEYLGTMDNITVKISSSEVNAISNILDAYDALNK